MVGLGGIGQRHTRNIRALLGDDAEILAYRTRGLSHVLTDTLTIEPGADLETRYNVQRFDDLDKALSQKPDVVFITNPSSYHISPAIAAAEAGCHLFIEKPLSNSLEGVEELTEITESKQLTTLIGYQLRFHPCFRLVKKLLDEDAIGTLLAARLEVGEYLPAWHSYEDYRQMYASRKDQGGGVIVSQIHELDLVYWWFGMPSRVFALGGHWSSLEIDVEDTASILLECEYQGRSLPVHVQLDYIQRPPSRTCQIVGEKGKILVDLHALQVRVVSSENPDGVLHDFSGLERNKLFADELDHFFACVAGEAKPEVDVREGANSLRIALAAYESIEKRAAVEL